MYELARTCGIWKQWLTRKLDSVLVLESGVFRKFYALVDGFDELTQAQPQTTSLAWTLAECSIYSLSPTLLSTIVRLVLALAVPLEAVRP
jgi:hypothetical protein